MLAGRKRNWKTSSARSCKRRPNFISWLVILNLNIKMQELPGHLFLISTAFYFCFQFQFLLKTCRLHRHPFSQGSDRSAVSLQEDGVRVWQIDHIQNKRGVAGIWEVTWFRTISTWWWSWLAIYLFHFVKSVFKFTFEMRLKGAWMGESFLFDA